MRVLFQKDGELTEYDKEVLEELALIPSKVSNAIESYRFREAQAEAMSLARLGNKYLADTEPWKLIKTDPNRVKTIMNIALQITANLTVVFEPFLPFTSNKLADILGIKLLKWDAAGQNDLMNVGHVINKAELLFSKIENDKIEEQIAKLERATQDK